ncbi:MAG: hypothetical protein ACR2I0_10565, partial [Rhodoferax sp.]
GQSGALLPNLILMFDDSASMAAQFLYRYGGAQGDLGLDGPGSDSLFATCPRTLSITSTCAYNPPAATQYAQLSPDVNLLAYDPRLTYRPRINADGVTPSSAGQPSNATFYVYFYRTGMGLNTSWDGRPVRYGSTPSFSVSTGMPDPLLASSYFRPQYTPNVDQLANTATPLAYPNAVTDSSTRLPKFINRSDCVSSPEYCTLAEERQNYANWLKYHSNRLDLAKTGMGLALQHLGGGLRLGWGRFSSLAKGQLERGVAMLEAANGNAALMPHRISFYNWLYSRSATASDTSSRLALDTVGRYLMRKDDAGPWSDTPNPAATATSVSTKPSYIHSACRRNYALMFTDGYYNDTLGLYSVGNVDGSAMVTHNGTNTSGNALEFHFNGNAQPYSDAIGDSLADVAMKYWLTDLRPDLANRVTPTDAAFDGTLPANPAFWQNLS